MCKASIADVDDAVTIVVEFGKMRETRTVRSTEHLGDIVDPAIAVAVDDDEAVVRPNPAGLFCEEIAVKVEVDARLALRHRLDAIAVEVDDERIVDRLPADRLGQVPEHVDIGHQVTPDEVPARDFRGAVSVRNAEGHAEVAGSRTPPGLVLPAAERVVLDHHDAVDDAVVAVGRIDGF
ncbi:hypothetical protein D9M68_617960 [compost metagenome]